jgi:hypothetical protein
MPSYLIPVGGAFPLENRSFALIVSYLQHFPAIVKYNLSPLPAPRCLDALNRRGTRRARIAPRAPLSELITYCILLESAVCRSMLRLWWWMKLPSSVLGVAHSIDRLSCPQTLPWLIPNPYPLIDRESLKSAGKFCYRHDRGTDWQLDDNRQWLQCHHRFARGLCLVCSKQVHNEDRSLAHG